MHCDECSKTYRSTLCYCTSQITGFFFCTLNVCRKPTSTNLSVAFFSNSICLFCVFVSHFGDSLNFSDISMIFTFVIVTYDQWSFYCICSFIFGCAASSLPCGIFSTCSEQGPLSSCGVWASCCSGFSCCGAQALEPLGFTSCSPGACCGLQALELGLSWGCDIVGAWLLCSPWDVPRPGIQSCLLHWQGILYHWATWETPKQLLNARVSQRLSPSRLLSSELGSDFPQRLPNCLSLCQHATVFFFFFLTTFTDILCINSLDYSLTYVTLGFSEAVWPKRIFLPGGKEACSLETTHWLKGWLWQWGLPALKLLSELQVGAAGPAWPAVCHTRSVLLPVAGLRAKIVSFPFPRGLRELVFTAFRLAQEASAKNGFACAYYQQMSRGCSTGNIQRPQH